MGAVAFQMQDHLTDTFAHVLSVLLDKDANKLLIDAIRTHASWVVLVFKINLYQMDLFATVHQALPVQHVHLSYLFQFDVKCLLSFKTAYAI
jgi:hypothetical protein